MKFAAAFFSILLVTGCTSVSVIATNPRPSIKDWESVKVFTEEPSAPYETIGVLDCDKLNSMRGKQADTNTSIKALKKKAASVGANAIIITSRGQAAGTAVVGTPESVSPF
jgi:hypothetical protein